MYHNIWYIFYLFNVVVFLIVDFIYEMEYNIWTKKGMIV